MQRKTKIIATLGPATNSVADVASLIAAGMNVTRLNFSHGSHDAHREVVSWVRQAAEDAGAPIAIMQDIQGPRIRVGQFPGGAVILAKGSLVSLTPGRGEGSASGIYIEGLEAVHLVEGSRVLLSDGRIGLVVESVASGAISARVVEGGELKARKGAIFPDVLIDLPAVTDKDAEDLEFGQEVGVDWIAASFVTSGDDIRRVRRIAGSCPVIAKIERGAGYRNLTEILLEANGAMVARGDLGVELPLERIPRVQKDIIQRTNALGRFSITATEMLESMTTSSRPTRAEVTDVANAVLDGTDAVMLSGETAVGLHPARTVETMDHICQEAELDPAYGRPPEAEFLPDDSRFSSAIAQGCVDAATTLGLRTIVAFTESGSTARLVSKYRPRAQIVAFTPIESTYRQMAMYAGVNPVLFERVNSTDRMMQMAEEYLTRMRLAEPGEAVVMAAGVPPNQAAATNLIKLHVVGSATGGLPGH